MGRYGETTGVRDEFRERAVRLLREWREVRGVTEGGDTAVAQQLGMQRETLRRRLISDEVEGDRALASPATSALAWPSWSGEPRAAKGQMIWVRLSWSEHLILLMVGS